MGLFKRAQASAAMSRKAEEQLYELALDEFEAGEIRRGLWAQALAEANGEAGREKGVYLKLRVRSMLDEGAIVEQLIQEAARRRSGTCPAPAPAEAPQDEPSALADAGMRAVTWIGVILALVVLVAAILGS